MTPESRSTLVTPAGGLNTNASRVGNCVGLPVLDPERVLRRTGHRLAGNHVFSGHRPRATLDPDLPVGVDPTERKVLAFDAVDHPVPDVTGLDDSGHQFIVSIGEQQIRSRHCRAGFCLDQINQSDRLCR